MSYIPQLKNREYYENRYDRMVVTHCRMTERSLDSTLQKSLSEMKEGEDEKNIRAMDECIRTLMLYFEKWQLAIDRDTTIKEWMESDKERDDFFEDTQPKRHPFCIKCNGEMRIIEKTPSFSHNKKERHRILFMFECSRCELKRAFYDDGEEFRHEKQKCEKCQSTDLKSEIIDQEKQTIYRDTCNSCGYVKDDAFERTVEEEDLNYLSDREKYVLSEKEAGDYREAQVSLNQLHHLVTSPGWGKEWKSEGSSEEVATPQIRKLDFPDLKELITKALKKKKYKDITFSNPVVFRRWVNVELSIAGKGLEKKAFLEMIQGSLENTNWKLNEKSILVNLGILQCKLEGE